MKGVIFFKATPAARDLVLSNKRKANAVRATGSQNCDTVNRVLRKNERRAQRSICQARRKEGREGKGERDWTRRGARSAISTFDRHDISIVPWARIASTQYASMQFGEVLKMASSLRCISLPRHTEAPKRIETRAETEKKRARERERKRERVRQKEREIVRGWEREGGPIEGTHVSHLAAAATCSRASVVVPASPAPTTTTMTTNNGHDSATRNTPLVAAAVTVAVAAAIAHDGRCARRIAPATTARSSRLARYSRASASRGLAWSSPARRGERRGRDWGESGKRQMPRRLPAYAESHLRAGATERWRLIGGRTAGDRVARGLCCFGTGAALVTWGLVLMVFFKEGSSGTAQSTCFQALF